MIPAAIPIATQKNMNGFSMQKDFFDSIFPTHLILNFSFHYVDSENMEIVNCIGFKQSSSSFEFVLTFAEKINENFRKIFHSGQINRREERDRAKKTRFEAQKASRRENNSYSSADFLSFLRSLGSFCTFVHSNAKKIGLAVLVSSALFISCLAIFKIADYFHSTTGAVKLENNYEYEMSMLNKLMNNLALEGTTEYSSDGTLVDAKISEKDMEKLFCQPVTFQSYKVLPGDSISSITKKFGLSNISTLIAVNDIDNVRQLRAGQKLKIPSIDGLFYTVQKGNSLQGISLKYNVTIEDLLDVNELESSELAVGQVIFVPGAKLEPQALSKAMGELFRSPLKTSYRLTSHFGPRADPFTGARSNHTGVDMACPTGTPILAAASGTITYSGTSPVFGYYVIINHGNGYQSLYGHMSKILAKKGQWVSQGTRIGLVGSTGYSTGPHLHFTVFKNGKLVDPLSLIK